MHRFTRSSPCMVERVAHQFQSICFKAVYGCLFIHHLLPNWGHTHTASDSGCWEVYPNSRKVAVRPFQRCQISMTHFAPTWKNPLRTCGMMQVPVKFSVTSGEISPWSFHQGGRGTCFLKISKWKSNAWPKISKFEATQACFIAVLTQKSKNQVFTRG